MREIIFRGKRADNYDWAIAHSISFFANDEVYLPAANNTKGGIRRDENGNAIAMYGMDYKVIPETVGQYTGIVDKNGKKIFEGDIVKTDEEKLFEVKMHMGCWIVEDDTGKRLLGEWEFLFVKSPYVEVIGNIYDSPELLKD